MTKHMQGNGTMCILITFNINITNEIAFLTESMCLWNCSVGKKELVQWI